MKANEALGKTVTHKVHGLMVVVGRASGSRTWVTARVIERGPGWDPKTETYKGVKSSGTDHNGHRTSSWSRGENRDFGNEYRINLNDIE
jgi:hypothetical protein